MMKLFLKPMVMVGLLVPFFAIQAATVAPLSLAELTAQSDLIVEAKMLAGVPDWSGAPGASLLCTYWTAEVSDAVKGVLPPAFSIRVPGGSKDGRSVTVPGAVVFRPGQEAILFLKRTEALRAGAPVFEVLGFSQGAVPVRSDPGSGKKLVSRPVKTSGHTQAKPVMIEADQFKTEVRALLKEKKPEVSP